MNLVNARIGKLTPGLFSGKTIGIWERSFASLGRDKVQHGKCSDIAKVEARMFICLGVVPVSHADCEHVGVPDSGTSYRPVERWLEKEMILCPIPRADEVCRADTSYCTTAVQFDRLAAALRPGLA